MDKFPFTTIKLTVFFILPEHMVVHVVIASLSFWCTPVKYILLRKLTAVWLQGFIVYKPSKIAVCFKNLYAPTYKHIMINVFLKRFEHKDGSYNKNNKMSNISSVEYNLLSQANQLLKSWKMWLVLIGTLSQPVLSTSGSEGL